MAIFGRAQLLRNRCLIKEQEEQLDEMLKKEKFKVVCFFSVMVISWFIGLMHIAKQIYF